VKDEFLKTVKAILKTVKATFLKTVKAKFLEMAKAKLGDCQS